MNLSIAPTRLQIAVSAVCPGAELSVGTIGVSASVTLRFPVGATAQQQSDAQTVVNAFDWSAAADAAYKDAQQPDYAALRDQATAAFNGNATYLAIGSPTNVQVAAQVQALTQQNQKIIKALAKLVIAAI